MSTPKILSAFVGLTVLASASATPITIGSQRQVFIDGRFVTHAHGTTLTVHPPVKSEQITLEADHPDQTLIERNGTVLLVNGVYRMWYASFPRNRDTWPAGERHAPTDPYPLKSYPCYAESKDGIHWTKPDLGVPPPYPGAERNIVPVVDEHGHPLQLDDVGMVFLDPTAPPDSRFRMVEHYHNRPAKQDWLNILSSADGRHWRRTYAHVLDYRSPKHQLDSPNVIFWDDRIHQYVAYVRRNLRSPGNQGRTVARSASADLAHFPQVEDSPPVLKWDALDPHATVDGRRLDLMDFYTSAAFKYPDAQDAYFAFPSAYYHFTRGVLQPFADDAPTNAGTTDIQFAASRDGIHWYRYNRRPFVATGLRGSWDSMLLYMFRGAVPSPDGRHLYMYYSGSDCCHGWDRDVRNQRILRAAGLAPTQDVSRVSRLTLRRDGFVSAHAAYTGGEFTTPPLRFAGNQLVLNVDTSANGEVRVEIEDENGAPLRGFTLGDADRIFTANETNCPVSWRGQTDLSALAGQPIRLRFVMRDCDLYAFQFRTAPAPGK